MDVAPRGPAGRTFADRAVGSKALRRPFRIVKLLGLGRLLQAA
jgi:hypothetical protein